MSKHTPIINGLSFLILITERRGRPVLGQLQDKQTEEIIFEEEFPSYIDAYWVLKELDGNDYLAKVEVANLNK